MDNDILIKLGDNVCIQNDTKLIGDCLEFCNI